jgi:hypothetical protein
MGVCKAREGAGDGGRVDLGVAVGVKSGTGFSSRNLASSTSISLCRPCGVDKESGSSFRMQVTELLLRVTKLMLWFTDLMLRVTGLRLRVTNLWLRVVEGSPGEGLDYIKKLIGARAPDLRKSRWSQIHPENKAALIVCT